MFEKWTKLFLKWAKKIIHWGSTGDQAYSKIRAGLFRQPSRCHNRIMAPGSQSFSSPESKEGSCRKILQPSASSYSLWSESCIRSCSSPEYTAYQVHLLFKVKQLMALIVTFKFGSNN